MVLCQVVEVTWEGGGLLFSKYYSIFTSSCFASMLFLTHPLLQCFWTSVTCVVPSTLLFSSYMSLSPLFFWVPTCVTRAFYIPVLKLPMGWRSSIARRLLCEHERCWEMSRNAFFSLFHLPSS